MSSLIWEHQSDPDKGYEAWNCDFGQLYSAELCKQYIMSHFFVRVCTDSPGLYWIKIFSGGTLSYQECRNFFTIDEALQYGMHSVARFLNDSVVKVFQFMDRNYVVEGK